MQISYDYYRTFYYVAKLQSFTKAALALGGNQPNITRTIKNLEHTLGCTLFSRSNRRAELTPEGEKLFAHVSVAFEHLEAAEKEIALDRSLQSGIVTVSASESALHCFLLPILRNYRQQYPGVHIQVITDSTPGAISALRNGLADLSLVSTPMPGISGLKETDIKTFRDDGHLRGCLCLSLRQNTFSAGAGPLSCDFPGKKYHVLSSVQRAVC